ncbi:MAG: putative DNA binding domain-containing protein [Anaeroplasmataceae bacterium]|nr:putative DNA binding domain-containing protein [Anaeroplasmataceae bacterium]
MKNSKKILQDIFDKKLNYENEKIDYKEIFNFTSEREKLEIIKDIVSFANTKGGYIVYGVTNNFDWVGLDERSSKINDIQILDYAKKYISKLFEIKCGEYEINDNIFYLLSVEQNKGSLISFVNDGFYLKKKINGQEERKIVFRKNDQYGRIGSSSRPINNDFLFIKRRNNNYGIVSNLSNIERPYVRYIERPNDEARLTEKMNMQNIRNIQINGLGGIGKTSFVRDFCDKILDNRVVLNDKIDFIVWITGKMTLFLPSGETKIIRDVEISYEEILQKIAEVFEISDYDYSELENKIIEIMSIYETLIVFDNMETINDKKIIDFLIKVPHKSRLIFTTRENMVDLQYARIDLDGFRKEQFVEYFSMQIKYFDSKNIFDLKMIDPYINTFYSLVQGSPIMTNMIAYKIGQGSDINYLIRQLSKKCNDSSPYDHAMEFCFEEVFNTLDTLEKRILFILSISDSNEDTFSIPDLIHCTDSDENVIAEKMQKLYGLSFCNMKNGQYSSPNLVKLFANKKLSGDTNVDIKELRNKYYELAKEKERLGVMSNTFYSKAKAYTYEEKSAALQIKAIIDDFFITNDLDVAYKKIEKLEKDNPTFAYIFFRRALFEKDITSPAEIVKEYFLKAIELDSSNDHYWTEYAFYIEKINKAEAIKLFENAIAINDGNRSAHHGLAVCLTKLYNQKEEYFLEKDKIIEEFSKGYSEINDFYWTKHNINNFHAHATYLKNIKCLEEALNVCHLGLAKYPNAKQLLSLEGNIKLAIDPNYVNPLRIEDMKMGIFKNADSEIIKSIIKTSGYRKKIKY